MADELHSEGEEEEGGTVWVADAFLLSLGGGRRPEKWWWSGWVGAFLLEDILK